MVQNLEIFCFVTQFHGTFIESIDLQVVVRIMLSGIIRGYSDKVMTKYN